MISIRPIRKRRSLWSRLRNHAYYPFFYPGWWWDSRRRCFGKRHMTGVDDAVLTICTKRLAARGLPPIEGGVYAGTVLCVADRIDRIHDQ